MSAFHNVDVAVLGGGPAGFVAAIAAARMGCRVILIERHDVLGGMGTAALVNNFCPAHLDGTRLIIGGIFAEFRQRLADRKGIYLSHSFEYAIEPYHPKTFAEEALAMCRESGVEVLLKRSISRAVISNGQLEIFTETGERIRPRTAVDATGDAFLAAATGVSFTSGHPGNGAVMPLTLCYKIGPIDLEKITASRAFHIRRDPASNEPVLAISGAYEAVAEARARGDLSIPRDSVSSVQNIPGEPENATVNFGRVFIKDPTNPIELADAEMEGRMQIEDGIRFFRKYFPGFEKIELREVARQIGVRESRQIKGLYTLTGEDVMDCRQFNDVIAQCCYAIDVHDPETINTKLVELERGTHFDIPWRCLIPKDGPSNLVVSGRCVSATQEAMSSFRVSPSVMAIGEAGGVTAALAAMKDCEVGEVGAAAVQAQLRATGGILE